MLISVQIHEYKSSGFNLHNLLNFRCLQVWDMSSVNRKPKPRIWLRVKVWEDISSFSSQFPVVFWRIFNVPQQPLRLLPVLRKKSSKWPKLWKIEENCVPTSTHIKTSLAQWGLPLKLKNWKTEIRYFYLLKVKTELILTYRPWCPTLLDEQLNVIEWGDCMDYCPTEPVNSACLEEPEFPLFSDGTGLTENFTSTYERGSGIVTDEVFFLPIFLLLTISLFRNKRFLLDEMA